MKMPPIDVRRMPERESELARTAREDLLFSRTSRSRFNDARESAPIYTWALPSHGIYDMTKLSAFGVACRKVTPALRRQLMTTAEVRKAPRRRQRAMAWPICR